MVLVQETEKKNNRIWCETKRERKKKCLKDNIRRETTMFKFSLQKFYRAHKSRRIYETLIHVVK